MPIELILQQPALGIAWVAAILLAIAMHEFAHAAVATALGDSTARDAGRLTLNPLAHVDALGFLMLLFVGFGWGKPVPFDERRVRYSRWGASFIAFAGPLMNAIGVVVTGFLIAALDRAHALPANNLLLLFLAFLFQISVILLVFNLIPIPPLDGSKFLLGLLEHPRYDRVRFLLETRGPLLLLMLVVVDGLLGGAVLGRSLHAVLRWAAGLF